MIEIGHTDLDRELRPRAELVRAIASRIVRHGDVAVPGFIVIPATRHLVTTAERARELQLALLHALVAHLREHDRAALRPQHYVQLPAAAERRHHAAATLFVDERWGVFPGNKTKRTGGGQFHFDDLRTIITSLCYRGKTNAIGGTLNFIDLLRFARDRGMPVSELYSYHRLALGIGGGYRDDEQCPHQLCALVHPQIVGAAERYRTAVELDHDAFPIVIFTNRTSDGLVHTATTVRRRDPRRPAARPFTYANVFHADPWQLA